MRRAFISLAAVAALAAALPAQACQRSPSAEAVAEPYSGYAPTGYKGSLERDSEWFRTIRERKSPVAGERFVFRRPGRSGTARAAYESIEPVSLGGRRLAFMAWRQGCADLVDGKGDSFGLAPFAAWDRSGRGSRTPARDVAVLKLFETGAPWSGSGWRYALFRDGSLQARSPHSYLANDSNSVPIRGILAGDFAAMEIVAVSEANGVGVIDLDTLVEIIAPTQRGVGLAVGPDKRGQSLTFWRVDDGRTERLLRRDGSATGISGFDELTIVRDWGLRTWQRVTPGATVIEAVDHASRKCRLYDDALRLLVELDLWPVSGRCPQPVNGVAAIHLLANPDPSLHTQVYRVEMPGPTLTRIAEIDGGVVHVFREGSMLVQRGEGALARFRIVDADGKTMSSEEFDGYRSRGCGQIAVRRDGAWIAAWGDGVVAPATTYAFGC